MLIISALFLHVFYFYALCINGPGRIAPGKFRFDDDIAYLKDGQKIESLPSNKNTGKTVEAAPPSDNHEKKAKDTVTGRGEQRNSGNTHDGSFIGLSVSKAGPRTQSIGYTGESYPNPLTNPELCVHSSYGTHSMLCDPDGILTEQQQIEVNDILRKQGNYKLFVALAHTILVISEDGDTQKEFTRDLLRAWGKDENDALVLVYVEDLGKLSIATNVQSDVMSPDMIRHIEKTFDLEHSDVFEALKLAIASCDTALSSGRNGHLVVYAALGMMSISALVIMSYKKSKQN